ncbi:MAG: type III pantothenate kinase [Candidatus Omnitrophica bacterium]|nr:type III pantothenate kinase [Candidatus Omnitrophota bacterium]
MMLLVIDIGNTSITFGIFSGKKLIEERKIPTKIAYSLRECTTEIYNLPHRSKIKDTIISSVAPDTLLQLEKILKRVFKKRPLVLGRDIKAPIKNLYKYPEQVGQDRLVNGVAAYALYNRGSKKRPLLIIDFGTAVTFDVISKDNEYLGGLIFPGIRLSLENLSRRAALLPKIEIKRPKSLVGKDTKESMRSGLLNGYGSLCDGIVKRVGSLYKVKPEVIATGGDAPLIAKYANSIKKVEPNLTLKGLRLTYERGKTLEE